MSPPLSNQVAVVVCHGRSVASAKVVMPGSYRRDDVGDLVMTVRPIMQELTYGPGETFHVPADEAERLIAGGFVTRPGESQVLNTAAPALVSEFEDPTEEEPRPKLRGRA